MTAASFACGDVAVGVFLRPGMALLNRGKHSLSQSFSTDTAAATGGSRRASRHVYPLQCAFEVERSARVERVGPRSQRASAYQPTSRSFAHRSGKQTLVGTGGRDVDQRAERS